MKTMLIRLTGALLFSLLFYGQQLGLNMVLFALVAIFSVFITRPELLKRRLLLLAASFYLLSALFVFTTYSKLSIFSCLIAFLVFVGSISGFNNAIYVQWINDLYQASLGSLHQRMNVSSSATSKKESKYNYGFILLTIVVVVTLVSVFASLYGQANPILGRWIRSINLDFINVQWLLTTFVGYYVVLNITSTAELDIVTIADREATTSLLPKTIDQEKAALLKKEQLLGSILLTALNVLILLFISTDIWYVLHDPLAQASQLSKTVHEGVNALLISIIIAITTILVLFRGDLNFYKKSELLHKLTYLWIALNILIILITAYKNSMYSSGFGLTYKRIGVFIYLTLCISGMITTYIKIARKQNLLFMIQANARVAFVVLLVISSFNWDRTITTYNLKELATPDIHYLLTQLEDNEDLLYVFAQAHPDIPLDRKRITARYQSWQNTLSEQSWQSKTLLGILHPNTKSYEVTDLQTPYQ